MELLRMSKLNLDYDGVARIDNPPKQMEIASRVSCTREAVSRELRKLERLGIVERKRGSLVIHDFKGLKQLIGDSQPMEGI